MPWLGKCASGSKKKKKSRPVVSAPLHLLLKPEPDTQSHAFRSKLFKRPRPCNLCHQPIHQHGSVCRVCKYVCHKSCESKHTNDVPVRTPSRQKQVTMTPTGTRARGRTRDHGMDLSYVTERIIALWFPGDISPSSFRQGQQQAAHMLTSKHGNSYMVFNLSEPRRATRSQHERVRELGWPPDLAPPLERLCSICKDIDSWLSGDNHRIAVLHARGSHERIGVVVAAYMHYSNICGSADQALDRFAMKRYLDDKVGDLDQPSHKRYIDYFSGLLSGNIRINANPLYLTHVTVLGAPSFEAEGGCRAFLKVYEGLVPVYTSGVHTVGGDTRQFTVNVAGDRRRGLQLRGDILLKCYHRHYSADLDSPSRSSSPNDSDILPARELIFSCQFHTCAVADYTLSFTRQELDNAWNDLRFPLDGAVELHFSATPDGVRFPTPAPTPAVPVDVTPDSVTRWDSYENLMPDTDTDDINDGEVSHTYGPLDGSLYATVRSKKGEGVESAGGGGGAAAPVISSVHTVSMDSGISSAGNGLLTQPAPSYPDHHRALDELLSDMLLTVENIPDLPAATAQTPAAAPVDCRPSRTADHDIPYHARQDSRPFTYGSVPTGEMLRAQAGLSSPSLVRKASFKGDSVASSPVNGTSASVTLHRDVRRSNSSHSVPTARSPDFHEGTIVTGSISQHSSNNLTWLQRQQQKLRERREVQLRSERLPHETRLLSELRTVQTGYRSRPSPSQRLDGYTSDTTLFADEDEEDFTVPLHINTSASKVTNGSSAPVSPLLPHRTSSRRHYATSASSQQFNTISNSTVGRHKSEFERERPFVAVKRSHEQNRKYSDSTSPDSYSGLSHSIPQDSGLLVEAEQERCNNGFNNGVGSNGDALACLIASLAATSSPSNGSDATNSTASAWSPSHHQLRDESYSSWRTTSLSEDTGGSPPHSSSPRPQTPAFPVHPRTPYINSSSTQFDTLTSALPPKSPTAQRKEWSPMSETLVREHREHSVSSFRGYESDSHTQHSPKSHQYSSGHNGTINGGQSSPSVYYGHSRRSSIHSNGEPPQEVSPAHVKFVRDTSRFWYKPTISREEAISMLKDRSPGTFVVRDSNSFPGAFGLALKVATPPPSTPGKAPSDPSTELVRHFLIEPTSRGVRLKGCANEPVFSSLSALVYQHSLMPLALPCKLALPESDTRLTSESTGTISTAQLLLAQGAACNVLYLLTIDTESLTGPQAIVRAISELFSKPLPPAAIVHFKVSGQGITLTDNKRQLFFRRHYPVTTISYCGLDPDDHRWTQHNEAGMPISSNRCFGFVARKPASKTDNQCHIFAELEPEQPATAIVNFVSKVMMNSGQGKSNIV
ncbi:tensin-1-like isoform X4 [Homalodisca vitripennis]|uniref:tensin-1-like isoform X4 n=1 Tax=Homalodisca vitripennis TaxID=197043 RepID=UPI001EEAC380|nr:tensin-1-like isoform X4 [Homalodisca vitripennis]